jgi:hypothetical protein
MTEFMTSFELHGKPYGFTCIDCPERGSRAIEGDWVSYDTTKSLTGRETLYIGLPKRCKKCNAKYQVHKRATEAINRLYFVKPVNDGWEFLKFVTITRELELSPNKTPSKEEVRDFKKWYVKGRDIIRTELNILGGTDVVEIVTTEKQGLFHHHMHIHGIWIMPYMKVDTWRKAMDKVGFGRDQIRAIKNTTWTNDEGKVYETSAIRNCIKYLSKYLSKDSTSRRMMWGEVRRWKEHFHPDAPSHIKTMRQYDSWKSELGAP